MQLSILCVTTNKPRATPFLADFNRLAADLGAECVIAVDGVNVHSKGYIESVLDEAIALTHGDYVLRLDDDERCSPAMIRWLQAQGYRNADHWTFPRVHLWENPESMLLDSPFFPDYQTRLSVRAKAGGRPVIHSASPFGWGCRADVCLEHWHFLVKSQEEQAETSRFYMQVIYGDGPRPADPRETSWPIRIGSYADGAIPLHHYFIRDGKIR